MELKNKALFKQKCFINGEWVSGQDKIEVHNPATQKKLGTIPKLTLSQIKNAIKAAHQAFPSWRDKTAKDRCSILLKWYQLILDNIKDLARLMTLEQGKPLAESLSEIEYGASFIQWFANEALRIDGDIIPALHTNQRILVIKQPIGVVAAITPWNFPNAMITRKCSPALAAGCTVVLRPSSETPFSALALAYLAERAGFPPGVINVITGDAPIIGKALATHPLIKKLSFTGSTQVGKSLLSLTVPTLKKVSLELGGNAPFIVFNDADIDAAVEGAVICKFRNMGQTCVCANRFLVQDKIFDQFLKKFITAVKQLKLGNGLTKNVTQGPLISVAAIKKVKDHIADALKHGAKIILGGKPSPLGGTFFEPTILINMSEKMKIAHEETFGPVAPIFRFKTPEEAIALANNTEFGLASYFYSQRLAQSFKVAEAIESGMVGVNTGLVSNAAAPFGGVKESGLGREGSKYGIDEFVEIKYICLGL